MKKLALLVAAMLIISSGNVFAGLCGKQDAWIAEKVASDQYLVKTGGLILDGINRVVAAPVEALDYAYNGTKNAEQPVIGLFEGTFKGIFEAGESIVIGVLNAGLSIIPDYHGIQKEYSAFNKQ